MFLSQQLLWVDLLLVRKWWNLLFISVNNIINAIDLWDNAIYGNIQKINLFLIKYSLSIFPTATDNVIISLLPTRRTWGVYCTHNIFLNNWHRRQNETNN